MTWILIVLAVLLALLGLFYGLRLLSYGIRGVGMTWAALFEMLLIGAIGMGGAAWLLSWNLPAILP